MLLSETPETLRFGNVLDIERVYKGKQNTIRRKKLPKKKTVVHDFEDIRKFLLAKGYIEVIDGQTRYIYEKLVTTNKYGMIQNLSLKDLDKMYNQNLKLLKKYNTTKDSFIKEQLKKDIFFY